MTARDRFAIVPLEAVTGTLTDREFRVYALLRSYADRNGLCFPRQAVLAKALGSTRTKVNQWLKALAAHGWITVIRHRGTCSYQVNMAPVAVSPDEVAGLDAALASADVPRGGTSDTDDPAPESGTVLWERMLGDMPPDAQAAFRAWAIAHPESYKRMVAGIATAGMPAAVDRRQTHFALPIDGMSPEAVASRQWEQVKRALEDVIGATQVRSWLARLALVEVEHEKVTLRAEGEFARRWIVNNYDSQLLNAWQGILPGIRVIEIIAATPTRKKAVS
jgi:hypothetical protein